MRKTTMAALAVLILGTIVLPGCVYVGPYGWWWYPEHDGRWERHQGYRGRHGALTPPQDERGQRDDHARRGHDNESAG